MGSAKPAAIITLAYAAAGTLWIVLSGEVAQALATDADQLAQLEAVKGIGYVVVTSLALFLGIRFAMERQARAQQVIAQQVLELAENDAWRVAEGTRSVVLHDMANMLMIVRSAAVHLGPHASDDDETAQVIEDLDNAAQRIEELYLRIRRSADLGAKTFADANLAQVVRAEVALLRKHPDVQRCTLEVVGDEAVPLRLDAALVERVVDSLCINAAHATQREGRVRLSVHALDKGAALIVEDDGPGLDEEAKARVFQERFTTKPDGSGLGLTSVVAAARAHGGTVRVDDSPELGGARFTVTLGR